MMIEELGKGSMRGERFRGLSRHYGYRAGSEWPLLYGWSAICTASLGEGSSRGIALVLATVATTRTRRANFWRDGVSTDIREPQVRTIFPKSWIGFPIAMMGAYQTAGRIGRTWR